MVLFSEGTVHGARAWTAEHQRRVCLYRFSPATNCYGRSYLEGAASAWPASMYEGMTERQRCVLEPPYAERLDRPSIQEDGTVGASSRNEAKKAFDKEVFGGKYF